MLLVAPVVRALRSAATYDFFPRISGRTRAFLREPVGILLVTMAITILCGLVLHPRMFALTGGLGLVIAIGVCWPWVTVRAVRAELTFDAARTTEDEAVGVRVSVTNTLPWPAWGLSVSERGTDAAGLAARLSAVGSRTRTVARWSYVPVRRGMYPHSTLFAVTGFPFGMWESKRLVAVEAPLLVWPRTFPVGPVPRTDGADVVEGNVTRNKVGSTGDVLGVRPYRRGDSPRRIHWAQTARHDRLIVCELQSNSRPVVLLVLDADPNVHSSGPDGSREWAIRVLASMAKGWIEDGAQVGAAWCGALYPPAAGPVQLTRILDGLARLPDSGHCSLADMLPTLRTTRAGIRIVITTNAGFNRVPIGSDRDGLRFAVLAQSGFCPTTAAAESIRQHTCDEGAIRDRSRVWIEFAGPAQVPHRLRHGWTEARHGS